MYQKLKYVVEKGIANITLNRPEVFNAFDDELSYELQSALKESAKNDDVRVLVISGEGKAFCSGQDLKAVSGVEKRSF
ncbi:MAG: enoyl-CoA hydratase/isomerase family protein, partial [Cytophagales bacterium]